METLIARTKRQAENPNTENTETGKRARRKQTPPAPLCSFGTVILAESPLLFGKLEDPDRGAMIGRILNLRHEHGISSRNWPAAADHHSHVLLAIHGVRDRARIWNVVHPHLPQRCAGGVVVSLKITIERSRENHAACGIQHACCLRRALAIDPQRLLCLEVE